MLQGSKTNNDSFGYFTPERTKRIANEYKSRSYQDIINAPFVVGHNRFSTKGANTKKNAHPFQSNRFIWVHNGIINNDEQLKKRFKLKIKAKVDSAIIGHVVEHYAKKEKSIENAIKSAIEQISGDYSVFLYDKITRRLFYFRNSLRTFETALLYEKKNNRYILIGSTNGENIDKVYTKQLLGFNIRKAEVLSRKTIMPNALFEVNGNGFEHLANFTPAKNAYLYPYNSFYNERANSWEDDLIYRTNENYTDCGNMTEQEEVLNYNIIERLRSIVEKLGFDLIVTPQVDILENNTEHVSGVFISGKDTEEFMDIYNEYFTDLKDSTMDANSVITFINDVQDYYERAI